MQPRCEWYRIQLEMTMQAAPAQSVAEPGITATLTALDQRAMKLVRFAHVKRQLRDLRAEYYRLEDELWGPGAAEALMREAGLL